MGMNIEKVSGEAEEEMRRVTDAAEAVLGCRLERSSSRLEQ